MSKQTLTKTISTLTKSEENFQKKFLKHSQDTLDHGNLLKGIARFQLVNIVKGCYRSHDLL